jgi:hypothetical protein
LRGRKFFVWGQGTGGRRWQEWLSPGAGPYAEIQSGLAPTQFQHLAMPAGAEWSWLEAYGNAGVDPSVAHGADWGGAVTEGQARVDRLIDRTALGAALVSARSWADLPPHRMIATGTGWGALESARRRRNGDSWVDETGTPFPAESISADQEPWRDLLSGAGFSGSASFVAGEDWETLLTTQESDPHAILHRAVMAHARGDKGAAALYRETLQRASRIPGTATDAISATIAQAHRGLALLALSGAQRGSDPTLIAVGIDHYEQGCRAAPGHAALLVEAVTASVHAGMPETGLQLIARAEAGLAQRGRVRFLTALALARSGRTSESATILRSGVEVADLREGENSLSALWQEVCPDEEVPPDYQFSMS